MGFRITIACIVAVLAATSAVHAGPLEEKQAGIAAAQRRSYDEALALFTRALNEPGLSADDRADLFLLRGFAYEQSSRFSNAIDDYGAVLKLKPDAMQVHFRRAIAFRENGEYSQALTELDSAMESSAQPAPDEPFVFGERGVVRFALGRFGEAARDFARVLALDPTDKYGVLWLQLSRNWAGEPDRSALARDAAKVKGDDWPGPLLQLYLGNTTQAQVRSAVAASAADLRNDLRCEAAFFIGDYTLMGGDTAAARALLHEAAETCSPSLSVHAGARGELKRIGD